MKQLIHFVLIILLAIVKSTNMHAQNLVPNPSFEIYDTCPNLQNQIQYATGWSNFWDPSHNSSPDYFNACSTSYWTSVPHHFGDYQLAASGNAYAGIYTFESIVPNTSEYIGAQLLSPLIIGNKYYLSFKVNLALDINHSLNQATNNIGMLFSTVQHNYNNPTRITNFAHLNSTSVITDTMNWTTISGSFIADSAYQYVIIGKFFDDAQTIIVQMQDTLVDRSAYYYIDEVYVSTDSIPDGITEQDLQDKINVYPNPFSESTTIEIDYSTGDGQMILYDFMGKEIRKYFNIKPKTKIDRGDLLAGVYFLKFEIDNRIFIQKLIIQ
jgi:hypothetical protein